GAVPQRPGQPDRTGGPAPRGPGRRDRAGQPAARARGRLDRAVPRAGRRLGTAGRHGGRHPAAGLSRPARPTTPKKKKTMPLLLTRKIPLAAGVLALLLVAGCGDEPED